MRTKSRRVVLWNYDEQFANVSPLGIVRMRCELAFCARLSNINRQTKTSGALAIILEA